MGELRAGQEKIDDAYIVSFMILFLLFFHSLSIVSAARHLYL